MEVEVAAMSATMTSRITSYIFILFVVITFFILSFLSMCHEVQHAHSIGNFDTTRPCRYKDASLSTDLHDDFEKIFMWGLSNPL